MPRRPPITDNIKTNIWEMYKIENKRGQEIADLFSISVQSVFRIIREMEGKPNWKKPKASVRCKGEASNLLIKYNKKEHPWDDRYCGFGSRDRRRYYE